MNMVFRVRPIVGAIQRLRVTKRRVSIVNVERRVPIVMRTDRCTITSGLWYRTHVERGRSEKEWSKMD
jgi:hypothetical protein